MSDVIEEIMMNEWAYNIINNPEKCRAFRSGDEIRRVIDTGLAYNIINRYKISGDEIENARTN
ncbi:MAG: hypothetical protein Q7S06_02835 [Nanoarchaeota archaeon]|nr:hypothetical protein [Nanoarchaeota archaeon]